MPIKGLTGRVRAPRVCKIRLGYKRKGANGEYPRDTDVFVLRAEDQGDEVAKPILDAYNKGEIAEAEGRCFSLGKSLRMMLPWDFDLSYEGREVGLELMNRAWSHSKMRCSGTGGDEAGDALCRDKSMADEIGKTAKHKPVAREDGESWDVVCLGPRCPFWHSNMDKNKLATCHREMRLWAWLLDPTTNPDDKNFLKKLASIEIASGSFNGMIDVQSGFRTIHSLVGRTALIPFTLRRIPRTVFSDGKRVTKATLLVDFDQDEVIRFGFSDPKLAVVRPEARKQLMAQKEEELRLAALASNYDTFKDIVPRLEQHPAATDVVKTDASYASGSDNPAEGVVTDRDQAIDQAAGGIAAAPLTDEELNRRLAQGERDELKILCGGQPGDRESQRHFRELVVLAFKDLGDWKASWDADAPPFSDLRVKHAFWIREAVAAEKGAA